MTAAAVEWESGSRIAASKAANAAAFSTLPLDNQDSR